VAYKKGQNSPAHKFDVKFSNQHESLNVQVKFSIKKFFHFLTFYDRGESDVLRDVFIAPQTGIHYAKKGWKTRVARWPILQPKIPKWV
jgi:hypothetical protein